MFPTISRSSDGWVLVALYFIILQFLIITALALLFSSFSSPLLSAVFAFSLFVIGSFAEDLRGFAGMTHGATRWLATGAAYLVPNFSALNVISSVAHEQPVSGQLILYNTRLRAGLRHHGDVRSGADLRAPEPEMKASPASHASVSAGCCWYSGGLSAAAAARRPDADHATLEEVLYISSPKALKRLSLGYNGLLADIYWTRAVQYFGNKHHDGAQRYDLLAPLLEITTTLDPHLLVAYEYGANFLASKPPNGAGMPERAIELVEYGIRNNPDDWRLYYEMGLFTTWN